MDDELGFWFVMLSNDDGTVVRAFDENLDFAVHQAFDVMTPQRYTEDQRDVLRDTVLTWWDATEDLIRPARLQKINKALARLDARTQVRVISDYWMGSAFWSAG